MTVHSRFRDALAGVTALLLVVLVGCTGQDAPDEAATGPMPRTGNMLFVLRGDGQVENGRLSVDDAVTEWFTDRPERKAGFARAADLPDAWDGFGFGTIPPNAALSGKGVDAILELTDPKADAGATSFAFKRLGGEMGQGSLGPVTLFIDGTGPINVTMHVRAWGTWCKNSRQSRLVNPQVVERPSRFFVPPVPTVTLGDRNGDGVVNRVDRMLIFIPQAGDRRSNFKVRYTALCRSNPKGTVMLSGSLPSVWYNPKHFRCLPSGGMPGEGCYGYATGQYRPSGSAVIGRTGRAG